MYWYSFRLTVARDKLRRKQSLKKNWTIELIEFGTDIINRLLWHHRQWNKYCISKADSECKIRAQEIS